MRDPAFWWYPESLVARMLAPAAALYGGIAARRMAQVGQSAGVPVICIGNLTLGDFPLRWQRNARQIREHAITGSPRLRHR